MKAFACQHCGHAVYFDSMSCVQCEAVLGFDADHMAMRSLRIQADDSLADAVTDGYRFCANHTTHNACNWLVPIEDSQTLCQACRCNRTIPNLAIDVNVLRWKRFEAAKRRLIYGLKQLRLPVVDGFSDPTLGMRFDLLEDARSNPTCYPDIFVTTGYHDGVITLNALETDDSHREAMRHAMNEAYRTLLGHLRHESGHHYWALLAHNEGMQENCRNLFGDERSGYTDALNAYYTGGPDPSWDQHFISPYASAHPSEDWAETWCHYLHITDALETAYAHQAIHVDPSTVSFAGCLGLWRELSTVMNELNRSMGQGDAYPFVVTSTVGDKLICIDQAVKALRRLTTNEKI